MLTVTIYSGVQIKWHVGGVWSEENRLRENLQMVWGVEATDNELQHLLYTFANLPTPRRLDRVVWFGDVARFICANLVER